MAKASESTELVQHRTQSKSSRVFTAGDEQDKIEDIKKPSHFVSYNSTISDTNHFNAFQEASIFS